MKKLNVLYCYFIHCLGGKETDFQFVEKQLKDTFNKVFINGDEKETNNVIYCYRSSSNSGFLTAAKTPLGTWIENDYNEYTRTFENNFITELKSYKEKYNNNNENEFELNIYITIVGHSIGGNVGRAVIARLYSPLTKNNQKFDNYFEWMKKENPFISDIKPCSYVSINSPHLGSLIAKSKSTENVMKKTERFFVRTACNSLLGKIGKELAFGDDISNSILPGIDRKISKYLLVNNCCPEAMDALAKFPNRTLFSNIRYDMQVKYCSAMGCLETPLPLLLEKEKDVLVPDNEYDARIVMYSGFNEGSELEYYQKELFNEVISKDFYYKNTKYVPSLDIDAQIKNALNNKRKYSLINEDTKENHLEKYEEMDNEFVDDNDQELSMPVAIVKLFNKISFRRITIDLVLQSSLRISTHGISLDADVNLVQKPYMRKLITKIKSFYCNLLITDFIKTSKQTVSYSLLNVNEQ